MFRQIHRELEDIKKVEEERLQKVFARMDRDGDRFIGAQDLKGM